MEMKDDGRIRRRQAIEGRTSQEGTASSQEVGSSYQSVGDIQDEVGLQEAWLIEWAEVKEYLVVMFDDIGEVSHTVSWRGNDSKEATEGAIGYLLCDIPARALDCSMVFAISGSQLQKFRVPIVKTATHTVMGLSNIEAAERGMPE